MIIIYFFNHELSLWLKIILPKVILLNAQKCHLCAKFRHNDIKIWHISMKSEKKNRLLCRQFSSCYQSVSKYIFVQKERKNTSFKRCHFFLNARWMFDIFPVNIRDPELKLEPGARALRSRVFPGAGAGALNFPKLQGSFCFFNILFNLFL